MKHLGFEQLGIESLYIACLCLMLLAVVSSYSLAEDGLTDADVAIKKAIIKQSIERYKGACPCPYSINSAGRRCGKRSAYSKPGGESPICYKHDVSEIMLKRFKRALE